MNSHRKTTKEGCKSEATSTQDTNHSDARGRVNQETTLKGNGSQSMEAMDKFTEWELKKKKISGKSRREKREGNTKMMLLRNWFKKIEPGKKKIFTTKT